MAKLFDVRFDAETDEIETGYKTFQNHCLLKRRAVFSAVYIIILALGVVLIIKNPSGLFGYIAAGLALGAFLFNLIQPVMVRRKIIETLSALDTHEEYMASFFDDRIEVETITDPNEKTEIVAVSPNGIYTVEEGSAAEKEIPPDAFAENAEKSVYRLSEAELLLKEKDGLLLIFINRATFQTIPLRCLSEEQAEKLRAYFSERELIA